MNTNTRTCVNCASDKTRIQGNHAFWYRYKDGYICQRCYDKLIHHPKWNPIMIARRISFQGKRILLGFNPRTGQCAKCLRKIGEGINRTNLHHTRYHLEDPLKDTIELCIRCHRKEHARLK